MDDPVTLAAYADQVRELIRNDRNDQAIAICKHILRYYPKYVDAYRQLGEAFLEKGQLDDAKGMFRRVLSADPENVVAYAGLGVILEQEQLVAEATWHMERAYELSPGNTELHKELQRLYHELDGRPRARLKLTPGALARVYVQEGFFAQAIQELNAIVAESPARFDVQVALAETLWHVGQMRQAAEIAQALIDFLPYCLKANLILGAVWKETGLTESEQYLQRAQSLDPTNQIAQHLFGTRSPLPLTQVRVPRYIESAPAEAQPVTAAPVVESVAPTESARTPVSFPSSEEPAREPDLFIPPTLKPPVIDTTLPPWLRAPLPSPVEEAAAPSQPVEPVAEAPVETTPEIQPTEELNAESAAEPETGLPSWLAQLRQAAEPSTEPVPEAPTETEEAESALPSWIRAEPQAEESTSALPSWIEEVKSTETTAPPAPQEQTQPEEESALPAWVTEEPRAEEAAPAPSQAQPREEELSAWLGQPAPSIEVAAPAEPTAAPKRKRPMRGDSHLILARTYRDANQLKEALTEYDYVVQKAPRLVNQVIADLQGLSKRPDMPLEVHRILGDAYTRADRLPEALEEYRFVLGHVS